jgi:uncharacterized protein
MKWINVLWPLAACFMLMHNPVTHFPVTFIAINIFVIAYKLLAKQSPAELGIKRLRGIDIGIALIAFLLIELSMDLLIQPLVNRLTGEPADYSSFAFLQGKTGEYLKWLAYMWISAAFGEELLFRSFVFDRLQRLNISQPFVQVLWSSLLFSLPHLYQGATGLIVTFLFGCFFGVLYRRYQNLWINMLAHGLTDTLFLTLSYKGLLHFYSV